MTAKTTISKKEFTKQYAELALFCKEVGCDLIDVLDNGEHPIVTHVVHRACVQHSVLHWDNKELGTGWVQDLARALGGGLERRNPDEIANWFIFRVYRTALQILKDENLLE